MLIIIALASCAPTILPDEEIPAQQYATITFDKNAADAIGSMETQSIPKGFARRLKACGYTRTNYIFAGWARTENGAVEYPDTASFSIGNANVTLYAQWILATRTITFDKNHPSALGSMSNIKIANGSSIYLPANSFTRPGYQFAGWSLSAEGPIQFSDQAKFQFVDANVTLYAQWIFKTYNVGDRGPANGYIFYVNPNYATDGWRYLEAADRDVNNSGVFVWEVPYQSEPIAYFQNITDAQYSEIGFGYSNSMAIASKVTTSSAAFIVFQFAYACNGFLFSDWFLPSYDELFRMYTTIKNLPGSGFSNYQYWSSTQYNIQNAYYVNFNNGSAGYSPKNAGCRIRPVRRF